MTAQDKREIAARSRAKRLAEMKANEYDRAHGTTIGYDYGCRCKWCVEAKSERMRKWYAKMGKERRKARYGKHREQMARNLEIMRANPKDKRHGTPTGYDYGCRCYRCCFAKSEQMRIYNRKREA